MKPFSLEEYLKNPDRKVITKGQEFVRIICTDMADKNYPIVALVRCKNGGERLSIYTANGRENINYNSYDDLFFAPEKHGVWIVIYRYPCGAIGTADFITYPEVEQFKNNQPNIKILKEEYLEWEE